MTMAITQVRLPTGLVEGVDKFVEKGLYASKSDAVRDAVRRLILEKQVGSFSSEHDSAEEVRGAREVLSEQNVDISEINSLHE